MVRLIAMAVLALGVSSPGPEPAKWEVDYGKALAATKTDEHPLLVVLDKPGATEARIAPELLAPSEADAKDAELLKPYQLCHVDVTTDYGQKVADAFKAKTFPYVAVIDKTGSVIIYSKTGKLGSDEWSRILSNYKSGDRSLAVTRVTYKLVNPAGSTNMGGYCPTCQQRALQQ